MAIEWGAVEWLLVCGKPNKQLAAAVKRQGGKVLSFFQNTNPIEFHLVSQFTGVCANLRFPLPDQDQVEEMMLREENSLNMRMLSTDEGDTVKPKRSTSSSSSCLVTQELSMPIDSILRAYLEYNDGCSSDSESEHSDTESLSEDALDEIESLQAIFPTAADDDDVEHEQGPVVFHRIGRGKICLFVVTVNSSSSNTIGNGSGSIALRVMLPENYPEMPLDVVMEAYQGLTPSASEHITTSAIALCRDLKGDPALFSLALHLQDTLEATLKTTN
eukprot:m.259642 g.259642  ORF g.259642 m.259642 type:complete len:274 (+) comp38434_c0_seq1:450-1271(+)